MPATIIDPADLPAPPDLGNRTQYEWEIKFLQTLQNFINDTMSLANTGLVPYYQNGFAQHLASGTSALTITFTQRLPVPMVSYSVSFTPHWNTTWWVTNMTRASVLVNFGTPPPTTGTYDYFVYLQKPIGGLHGRVF
jgi:hypothetical protein